jgi:hypothetical protein
MALARRSAALPSTARLMDKGLLHAACCIRKYQLKEYMSLSSLG